MPRENRKRGRRAEAQKRKREEEEEEEEEEEDERVAEGETGELNDGAHSKRRKTLLEDGESGQHWEERGQYNDYDHDHEQQIYDPTYANEDAGEAETEGQDERPFYGLLDESEQEYFKHADGMLEVNQFADEDDRKQFLESVYKEAEGKELKLACSQSCSRLLERLILSSTPEQLKHLFQQFNGNFLHLVQHRFASHCCETLFVQSASTVTRERLAPSLPIPASALTSDPVVSMENLFLHAINELSGNLGYLMTDRFASHAFRVLLVVLSGRPLDTTAHKSLLRSRKKEHVDIARSDKSKGVAPEVRTVPKSFTSALEKVISESVAGLDTHYLRTLATHQTGNPVLQLLVELELTQFGKQKAKDENSIIRRLLPDDPIVTGTESASFVNAMLYDLVGSRLLETIVCHAPGKMFKNLFRELFKDRMGSLAKNEIAGYVVMKILERLSAEDLKFAHDQILPHIPNLAQRGRTAVIRTLVERCRVRNISTREVRDAIYSCWIDEDGTSFSVAKMLEVPAEAFVDADAGGSGTGARSGAETGSGPEPGAPTASTHISALTHPSPGSSTTKYKRRPNSTSTFDAPTNNLILHRSLLAQTMLSTPGPLSDLLFASISALPPSVCLYLASTSILSPVLQCCLTVSHAPVIFRRKLITKFYSHIGSLSLDSSGSHLVDAIWSGTLGMAFVRERVAEELAEDESSLKESVFGKKVWRNWRMDLYKKRRGEWVRMVRDTAGNDGFLSFPDGVGDSKGAGYGDVTAVGNTRDRDGDSTRDGGNTMTSGNATVSGIDAHKPTSSKAYSSTASSTTTPAKVKNKSRLDLARERHALLKNGGGGSGGRGGEEARSASRFKGTVDSKNVETT